MTIDYYMKYTGIPINFGITAALGFLVGTAIAGQTFYNFTLENLKQFGALKAMGATNGRIVKMILLQALVVGLLGYGIGVGAACFFGWGNQSPVSDLSFFAPKSVLDLLGISHSPYAGASSNLAAGSVERLFYDNGPALIVTLALMGVAAILRLVKLLKKDAFVQAVVVISLSYLASGLLAIYFMRQGMKGSELAFYTWWPVPLITGVAVVFICILASLISVRRVMVLEPAVVFRG